jgi:transposase
MKQSPRGRFTTEFKVEAVRLVKAGQSISMTAKVLGMSIQTLHSWIKRDKLGKLTGAGTKPVSDEQMEIARLRSEVVRLKMERDILKKATAYFARDIV